MNISEQNNDNFPERKFNQKPKRIFLLRFVFLFELGSSFRVFHSVKACKIYLFLRTDIR